MGRIYRDVKKKERIFDEYSKLLDENKDNEEQSSHIKSLIKTNEREYSKLLHEYDDLLLLTENHTDDDYNKVLFEVRNEKDYMNEPFDWIKCLSLGYSIVQKYFFITILVVLPPLTICVYCN